VRRSVTAFVVALMIYTGVSIVISPDYMKAVLTFATNTLIIIMGLLMVAAVLDKRPICDRLPTVVKVFGPMAYVFSMVVAMLVMIAGITMTINVSYVICCTADILRFIKNVAAAAAALVAANVMLSAAKACDNVIAFVTLFMTLAFDLIVVVGLVLF
jgi:hypothetical protein